ncbi:hypothetical protein MBA17_07945, partial [Streptosporangium sp. KLBMP 9127]|nr:hypothetical protein [Streptosporangium sp. KLBMP 9127]
MYADSATATSSPRRGASQHIEVGIGHCRLRDEGLPLFLPRLLDRTAWADRAPRLAIAMWQAAGASVV